MGYNIQKTLIKLGNKLVGKKYFRLSLANTRYHDLCNVYYGSQQIDLVIWKHMILGYNYNILALLYQANN